MANQELIDYIMHQRVHGASEANIKNALLHAGWEEGDIDKGLTVTKNAVPPPATSAPGVVIKPDQAPGATPPLTPKKHAPVLAILLLVVAIIIVAIAAVFVYLQFLRPQPVRKALPPSVSTSTASTSQSAVEPVASTTPEVTGPLVPPAQVEQVETPSATATSIQQTSTSTQL